MTRFNQEGSSFRPLLLWRTLTRIREQHSPLCVVSKKRKNDDDNNQGRRGPDALPARDYGLSPEKLVEMTSVGVEFEYRRIVTVRPTSGGTFERYETQALFPCTNSAKVRNAVTFDKRSKRTVRALHRLGEVQFCTQVQGNDDKTPARGQVTSWHCTERTGRGPRNGKTKEEIKRIIHSNAHCQWMLNSAPHRFKREQRGLDRVEFDECRTALPSWLNEAHPNFLAGKPSWRLHKKRTAIEELASDDDLVGDLESLETFEELRKIRLSARSVLVLDVALSAKNLTDIGNALGYSGKTAERKGKHALNEAVDELRTALVCPDEVPTSNPRLPALLTKQSKARFFAATASAPPKLAVYKSARSAYPNLNVFVLFPEDFRWGSEIRRSKYVRSGLSLFVVLGH